MARRRPHSSKNNSKPNESRLGILLIVAIAIIAMSFFAFSATGFSVAENGNETTGFEDQLIITEPPAVEPEQENQITTEPEQQLSSGFETQAVACTASISDCCLMNSSGVYTLTQNITTTDTCINITSNDIILNCDGFSLIGTASINGINVINTTNATIKNCYVLSFANGIILTGVSASNISNNTVYYNTLGINLEYSSSNIVMNNTARNNTGWGVGEGAGIYLFSSSSNNVTNNTVYNDTQQGIYLYHGSNNNIVSGNAAYNNSYGIGLAVTSDSNNITYNTAFNNSYAIYVSAGTSNVILKNAAYSNYVTRLGEGGYGIYLTGSTSNNITNNTAYYNTKYGIELVENSQYNNVTNNTAYNNTLAGICLYHNPQYNSLAYNTAYYNMHGIHLYTTVTYNNITRNTANNNTQNGIYLQTSANNGTLTNNTANYNFNTGIGLSGSLGNNVQNNTAYNNSVNIALGDTSNYNNVQNNTANKANTGIRLGSSSKYNIVSYNTANNNTPDGIYLDTAPNNTLYFNYLFGDQKGIDTILSNGTNMTNNTVRYSTAGNGININTAFYNILTSNAASFGGQSGIYLASSKYNNLTTNIANNNSIYGIYLHSSSNNTLLNNTANGNGVGGVFLDPSLGNTITGNIACENTYGITLTSGSNYNTLDGNTASNNTVWDVTSESSENNIFTNQIISSYPVVVSFTGTGYLNITGTANPPADPGAYHNISNYVEATCTSGTCQVFLNISYTDEDLGILNESRLIMAKYSPEISNWVLNPVIFTDGTYGVNTGENYVYANITDLASIFVPLEAPLGTSIPQVSLNKPADNANYTNLQNITFNFTYTSNAYDTTNCSIYFNGTLNQTNETTMNDTLTNFEIDDIAFGSYKWSINCTDASQYTNQTDNRTLNLIYEKPQERPPSGGSPGTTTSTSETLGTIPAGTFRDVTLSFGGLATFTSNGESHSIRISGIYDSVIELMISSDPIKATFSKVNEVKQFDTNNNSINDLEVTLLSRTDSLADFRIKALSEAGAMPAAEEVTPAATAAQPEEAAITPEGINNAITAFIASKQVRPAMLLILSAIIIFYAARVLKKKPKKQ